MLQIPIEKFSTTGLLVLLTVMAAGLLFIYWQNRKDFKRLQRKQASLPSATRKYSKEVERLLEPDLDDHEIELSK